MRPTLFVLAALLLAPPPAGAQTAAPAAKPSLTLGTLKAMDRGGKAARDRGFDNKGLLRPPAAVDVGDAQDGKGGKSKEEVIKEILQEDSKERAANKGVPGPDYEEPEEWHLDLNSKGAKIGLTVAGALLGAALGFLGGPIGAVIGGLAGAGLAAWLLGLFG